MAYNATHMPIERMREAIIAAKEGPALTEPPTVLDEAAYRAAQQSFELGSFSVVVERYLPLLRASKPLGWNDLAMLSYSVVRSGDQANACAKSAIASIKKNPLAHSAYLGLALLSMSHGNAFQAHSYLDLARLAGCDDTVKHYVETAGFVDFAWNIEAKSVSGLRPYILDEEKFKKLEKMYPEALANETFMAGVEEARANPACYEDICGENIAFSNLLNWIRRDPCPELFIEAPSDEKINEMALSAGGSFAQLPQSVITSIAACLPTYDQASMRSTNAAMNARLTHWTVWRMNYFRWQEIDYSVPDTACLYGKVGDLEWHSLCRSQSMVLKAMIILNECYGDFRVGGPFRYPPIPEDQREALRKLLDSHQSYSDASWEHPENVMLIHLLDHLAINKSANFLTRILMNCDLVATMTFMLDNRSPVSLTVCSLVAAVCWIKPNICAYFKRIGFFNLAKEVIQSDPAIASAVWASGLFSPIIGAGELPIGIHALGAVNQGYVERRTIADAQSMTSEEILSRTAFTSYGGLTYKNTVSGIYRLFFAYEGPELINEYDSGVVELIQNETNGVITGSGIDTFRGKFKVQDARGDATIREIQQDIKTRHANLHQVVGTVCDTMHLILEYESGEALVLSSACTVYAHTGSLEKAPATWRKKSIGKTHDVTQIFGAFCFSFDRRTNLMEGDERTSRFKELCDHFAKRTTPLKLGVTDDNVSNYERVQLRDLPMERFPMLDQLFCTQIRTATYWSQGALHAGNPGTHPSTLELFGRLGDPADEETVSFLTNNVPHLIPTRQAAFESAEEFELRLAVWMRAATNLTNVIISTVVTNLTDKLQRSADFIGAHPNDPEAILQELSWWSTVLRLLPSTWAASPQILLTILSFSMNVIANRKAKSDGVADAAAILLSTKSKSTTGWGVSTFFGTKLRSAITASSILLLTISVGLGAFALGQAISRQEKKKK